MKRRNPMIACDVAETFGRDWKRLPGPPMVDFAFEPEDRLLVCPKCEGSMVPLLLRGLTVERCVHCLGIFFDDGEVDELLGQRKRPS